MSRFDCDRPTARQLVSYLKLSKKMKESFTEVRTHNLLLNRQMTIPLGYEASYTIRFEFVIFEQSLNRSRAFAGTYYGAANITLNDASTNIRNLVSYFLNCYVSYAN